MVKIYKRICMCIVIMLFTLMYINTSYSSEIFDEYIQSRTESNEVRKVEEEIEKYSDSMFKEIIPEYDPRSILKDVAIGNFDFNLKGIINSIGVFFIKEIYLNVSILVRLLVLVVLCVILKNLRTSFASEGVGEIAFFASYTVVISILIVSFNTSLDLARGIIDTMVNFMFATIPILITLMISTGNIASGTIMQPVIILVVQVSVTIIRNMLLPLVLVSTILSIVNNISDSVQISRLANLLKQISGWCLALILTIFIALITVQGSLGAVVDGVTSKTTKFAIGAIIPVAGKYLADAADTVIGCTLLIKNSAGVAVMLGVISICLIPMLKMLALIAIYRITCVLIEPMGETRLTNCINEIANSLTFTLGIVATVVTMFLISITAIIGASNISTMIR